MVRSGGVRTPPWRKPWSGTKQLLVGEAATAKKISMISISITGNHRNNLGIEILKQRESKINVCFQLELKYVLFTGSLLSLFRKIDQLYAFLNMCNLVHFV